MPITREEAKRRLEGIVERGERVYETQLKSLLEETHEGEFLVIEPETGCYFLGTSAIDAMEASREAMPEDVFFLMRIGYQSAHTIGGHVRRTKKGSFS